MDVVPDTNERTRKRARTSSPTHPDLNAFEHDAKLWFSDGNIILACGSTGFCVHAGVLSLNCRMFKDMLASGTPSAGEVYEGIDVVRLSDAAEDVRLLLTPMYYRREGPMHSVYTVAKLKALLNMTRKYMADEIQQDAMNHLRELFRLSIEHSLCSQASAPILNCSILGWRWRYPWSMMCQSFCLWHYTTRCRSARSPDFSTWDSCLRCSA
ncbi:unnamed protein product [Peniophora sp. CBMAI 1063]|nr:unnamed protein product [Peniophora sp. CBMAI 1063]